MKTRQLAAFLGCLVLAACSSGTSGSPLAPTGSSYEARTPADTTVVDIHLLNKSPKWVSFETKYSYPISPVWFHAHQMCVAPGKNWNTYIDFKHPHPQVIVQAMTKTAHCANDDGQSGGMTFKDLKFENGRSKIEGDVEETEKLGYLLCLKRTGNGNVGCASMEFQ